MSDYNVGDLVSDFLSENNVDTAFGVVSLLLVVFGIYFYLIVMGEKYTQELYLERDTKKRFVLYRL